ncbi:MAG: VPLPA-CTERM-specific exosortase XrtD [Pseudomonadota bacterium]
MQIDIETRRYWWAGFSVLVLLIFYAHWHIITALYQQWMGNEDFSHGLLIMPISLYFIWKKRAALSCAEIETDWRALLLIVVAIATHVIGELGADVFTNRLSVLLLLIGCVWLSFGFAVIKILKFPLAFLFLMLPLPGFLYRNITFPLQLLSSRLSVDILNIFGVLAYREGNVIDMGFTQFEVAQACNGIRFIMPLLTVGILFAFFRRRAWWERLLLVCVTIPLAIFANVLRIAGTGFLSTFWGQKVAEGFFHSFSGWAVFMCCFGLFLLVDQSLSRLSGSKREASETLNSHPIQKKGMVLKIIPITIAFSLILSANLIVDNLGSVNPVPLKKALANFPISLNGWQGSTDRMDPKIWDRVGAQDYIIINYQLDGYTPVAFYTAYYEYQRKLGDFVHSPKLCLPGDGWYIHQSRVRELNDDQTTGKRGETLRFNELVVEKNDIRQLVYYWYQGRGRNFTSEYSAKFFLAFDGVFRRRTDGALVRLITPVLSDGSVEKARKTLDGFALTVSKELEGYLP